MYLFALMFALALSMASIFSNKSVAIEMVRNAGSDRLIIMIHGFNSSKETAFYNDAEDQYLYDKLQPIDQFRRRAAFEVPDYDVALAEYPANFCSSYTLSEIAKYVSNDFEASRIFLQYRSIVFIGHSLGGLVAKKVILDLDEESRKKVAGLVLLGTPSEGNVLADRATALPFFAGGCELLRDLRSIDSNSILQDTRERWTSLVLSNANGARPSVHCAYERLPIKVGLLAKIVVPQDRIDVACDSIHPASANHYTIASFPNGSVDLRWLTNAIHQSFHNAAFYSNAPQFGVGEIDIFTRASAYVDAGSSLISEHASTSLNGSRAAVEMMANQLQRCTVPAALSENRIAESSIEAKRLGRTRFRIAYKGVIHKIDKTRLVAINCDDRVGVGWGATARLTGTIAVGESEELVRIEFERMPDLSVELFAEDGRLVGHFADIAGLPSVDLDESGLSGNLDFANLAPGLYLIRIESLLLEQSDFNSRWNEDDTTISKTGMVGIELQ